MNLDQIDNIIFDLGGVLIDLDYQLTVNAFRDLGADELSLNYSQAQQTSVFDLYEIGEISTQQFINKLKPFVSELVSPNEIVHAWNAMILDFPFKKLQLLEELSTNKNLYLLSNTNQIHMEKVNRKLKLVTEKKLTDYFINSYFSHEIGRRKPHSETFTFVCEDAKIDPIRTLFIDDSEQHLVGAEKIGLNTFHYKEKENFFKLFIR